MGGMYTHLSKDHLQFLTEIRWHFFTAIGGYVAVATVDLLTSGEADEISSSSFAWPVGPVFEIMQGMVASEKKI